VAIAVNHINESGNIYTREQSGSHLRETVHVKRHCFVHVGFEFIP